MKKGYGTISERIISSQEIKLTSIALYDYMKSTLNIRGNTNGRIAKTTTSVPPRDRKEFLK